MHRWAAHGMVLFTIIHMWRVFNTGSYKPPRQLNWILGVILLVLTLLLSFTGYLLPWDQLSLWAITVGQQMGANAPILGHLGPFAQVTNLQDAAFGLVGGTEIGPAGLIRFYVLHVFFLPFDLNSKSPCMTPLIFNTDKYSKHSLNIFATAPSWLFLISCIV